MWRASCDLQKKQLFIQVKETIFALTANQFVKCSYRQRKASLVKTILIMSSAFLFRFADQSGLSGAESVFLKISTANQGLHCSWQRNQPIMDCIIADDIKYRLPLASLLNINGGSQNVNNNNNCIYCYVYSTNLNISARCFGSCHYIISNSWLCCQLQPSPWLTIRIQIF